MASQEDVSNLTQASPQRGLFKNFPRFTPKPRKPFTSAKEYRKMFIRRVVQVSKTQDDQVIRSVVQVSKTQGDQEPQKEVGQNF